MLRSSLSWRSRLTLWGITALLTLIAVTGIAGLMRLAFVFLSASPQLDFGVYYLAGAILESPDPDELFSMERLELEAAKRGMPHFIPEDCKAPYVYPPLLAVLMRWVSRLPYPVAETGWLGFNVLAILMSVLLLVAWNRRRRPGIRRHLVILLIVTLFTPAHSALMLGQVSPLLLCALSWAFVLLADKALAQHRSAQIAAGWLIGLASIVKLFPILLVPFLLWKRRFRALGWAIVSLVVYTMVGLLGGGTTNTMTFFVSFLPSFYGRRAHHGQGYNQSFSATLVRWLGLSPSISSLSLAFSVIILLVTCFALVRSRRAGFDDERLGLEYGLVLTSSILTLTYVTLNYYLLLLIPLTALWFSSGSPLRTWSVLGCVALICVHSLADWMFWGAEHLVPFGLMAVLLLWGVLVVHVGCIPESGAPRGMRCQ